MMFIFIHKNTIRHKFIFSEEKYQNIINTNIIVILFFNFLTFMFSSNSASYIDSNNLLFKLE